MAHRNTQHVVLNDTRWLAKVTYKSDNGPIGINCSASGLKQQDNDVIILHEASAAGAFEDRFERIWAVAKPLPAPGNLLARSGRATDAKPGAAAPGCAIKGNVNRNGERIYHVPGDRTYDRVQMDKGRDKRWFCSEEQAVAAGWRKAGTW